jgi:hypothetical protein
VHDTLTFQLLSKEQRHTVATLKIGALGGRFLLGGLSHRLNSRLRRPSKCNLALFATGNKSGNTMFRWNWPAGVLVSTLLICIQLGSAATAAPRLRVYRDPATGVLYSNVAPLSGPVFSPSFAVPNAVFLNPSSTVFTPATAVVGSDGQVWYFPGATSAPNVRARSNVARTLRAGAARAAVATDDDTLGPGVIDVDGGGGGGGTDDDTEVADRGEGGSSEFDSALARTKATLSRLESKYPGETPAEEGDEDLEVTGLPVVDWKRLIPDELKKHGWGSLRDDEKKLVRETLRRIRTDRVGRRFANREEFRDFLKKALETAVSIAGIASPGSRAIPILDLIRRILLEPSAAPAAAAAMGLPSPGDKPATAVFSDLEDALK